MRNVLTVKYRVVLALLAVAVVADAPVYAYLDPATGSMILQAVLGTVAAALVVVRAYWSRIKNVLTRHSARR